MLSLYHCFCGATAPSPPSGRAREGAFLFFRLLCFHTFFYGSVNPVAHVAEIVIDLIVWNAKNLITVGFQYCISFPIISGALLFKMLGTVEFQNHLRFGAYKVNNKLIDRHLSAKADRIMPQKCIPKSVFLLCCVSTQFLCSFCQITVSNVLHYYHHKQYNKPVHKNQLKTKSQLPCPPRRRGGCRRAKDFLS